MNSGMRTSDKKVCRRATAANPHRAGQFSASHLPSGNLEPLEARQLLSAAPSAAIVMHPNTLHRAATPDAASSADVQGYTPAQIKTAYQIDQVNFNGAQGDGSGQTIAIIDAFNDPNIISDLKVFDSYFGLSAPPSFSIRNESGGSVAHVTDDAGWAGEISLDVEWAHAIAPQANILLVEATSDNLNDLIAAVNYARSAPGVSVVTMSWGGDEFQGESAYDTIFSTPAGHNPVTFVTASGDDGPYYGPEWPATSDNVIAVGGTTLNLSDSAGDYSSEQPWAYSTGGTSFYEIEPRYQAHVQMTTLRDNPDVAYDGDPNTGFAVYDSVPYEGYVNWQEIGGTSAGSPQWASLIAIADQGRAQQGKASLDSHLGTLPALYAIYNSSTNYSANFNDVVSSGTSGFGRNHFGNGSADANLGYDLTTGLGTPVATALVNTLVNANNLPASRFTPSRTPRPRGSAMPVIVHHADRIAGGSTSTNTGASTSPSGVAQPAISQSNVVAQSPLLTAQLVSPNFFISPNHAGQVDIDGVLAANAGASSDITLLHRSDSVLIQSSIDGQTAASTSTIAHAAPIYFFEQADDNAAALSLASLMPADVLPNVGLSQIRGLFSQAGEILAAGVQWLPGNAAPHAAAAHYSIPVLGNAELFADALTGLVNDSAAVGTTGRVQYMRAWTITAAVLAADIALVAHWHVKRRQTRHATEYNAEQSPSAIE